MNEFPIDGIDSLAAFEAIQNWEIDQQIGRRWFGDGCKREIIPQILVDRKKKKNVAQFSLDKTEPNNRANEIKTTTMATKNAENGFGAKNSSVSITAVA